MSRLESLNEPLVSVIIPSYNRGALLRRAVASVLAQSYSNFECIIVDNGSKNETLEVAIALRDNDQRVKLVRAKQRCGASYARNQGVKVSKGYLLAFLDDDDEWMPEKLCKQVQRYNECRPDVGLIYCGLTMLGPAGPVQTRSPYLAGYIFEHLIERQPIGNSSTLLVPRIVFDAVGGFDENLPRGNDGDFIRRISLNYRIEFVPDILVTMHVDHGLPRITNSSADGVRKSLSSHEAKFTKFGPQINQYPAQKAALLATMGYHHALLNEGKEALELFIQAARLRPFSSHLYKRIAQALLHKTAIDK